jgi:hypothetical protein
VNLAPIHFCPCSSSAARHQAAHRPDPEYSDVRFEPSACVMTAPAIALWSLRARQALTATDDLAEASGCSPLVSGADRERCRDRGRKRLRLALDHLLDEVVGRGCGAGAGC